MSRVSYAQLEFGFARNNLNGGFTEDVKKSVTELIKTFEAQDHSGPSSVIVLAVFDRLVRCKPISPLRDKDDEWLEVGNGEFQNIRCLDIFKNSEGAYILDGSKKVPIEFPYRPAERAVSKLKYEYSDGGRAAAGFKGKAGDCVTRATAIFTGRPYKEVYKMMAAANKKCGGIRSARNGVAEWAYKKVFAELGIVEVKLPAGPNPTFSDAHEWHGDCIVTTPTHIAALINGVLHDTSDKRYYKRSDGFGYYETREKKAESVWVMK